MKQSVWFRELGFYSNPFSIKPAAFHDTLYGYDSVIEEVSYNMLKGKIVIVEGDYGFGKTTILRHILHDFGGKKQVIYYNCARMDGRLNIKDLLNGRYGFIGRLFNMKGRNMALLLDEAEELSQKDYQRIYSYYQEGNFRTIVFVGKKIKREELVKEIKDNMKEIRVGEINENDAVKIIRRRIGDIEILSDDIIRNLFHISHKNIRQLLKNCEESCRYAFEHGSRRVTDSMIRVLFEMEKKKEEKKEDIKKTTETKKEPVIIETGKKKGKGGKSTVYNPEEYKDMLHRSTEELLDKSTDELFGGDPYY